MFSKIIRYSRFRFELEALERIELPAYKGSVLRGAFGASLRKITCFAKSNDCAGCLLREECIYYTLFEDSSSNLSTAGFGNARPHPYLIRPPFSKQRVFQTGEKFTFEFLLFGKFTTYLPHIFYTFKQLGESGLGRGRGRYLLRKVERIEGEKTVPVFDPSTDELKNYATPTWFSNRDLTTQEITLHLLTPHKIKVKGKLMKDFQLKSFFKSLLRRASALVWFFEEVKLVADGQVWDSLDKIKVVSSVRWLDWDRYSSRQKTKMKFGGLAGEIKLSGNLSPLIPWLQLGEITHVGKSTVFGLGQYKIDSQI
jgi:hypothetical protein